MLSQHQHQRHKAAFLLLQRQRLAGYIRKRPSSSPAALRGRAGVQEEQEGEGEGPQRCMPPLAEEEGRLQRREEEEEERERHHHRRCHRE